MIRKTFLAGAALLAMTVAAGAAQTAVPAGKAKASDVDMADFFRPKISADPHQNFLDFDRDRDGYITFAEFSFAYRNYYAVGEDPVPLSQHFEVMDTDHNGIISEKEFRAGRNAPIDLENYPMRWVPNGHNGDQR